MTERRSYGRSVLVTRPKDQASELIEAIRDIGGEGLSFPVISIVPRDESLIASDRNALNTPDIAIFVSANAVRFGLDCADGAAIAVIGPATAATVRDRGQSVRIEPVAGSDSESLLKHPALANVAGQRIRIIRGANGRELLASALTERGASIDYLHVYDRQLPTVSTASRAAVETAWRAGDIGAITIMSVESLNNLVRLLADEFASQLDSVPLVTPATRVIKEILNRYPNATPVLARSPSTADMLEAILSIHTNDPGLAT